jgi:hypothetical protein
MEDWFKINWLYPSCRKNFLKTKRGKAKKGFSSFPQWEAQEFPVAP